MLRIVSVALILAASMGVAHADGDIYRWKDAQGIYHYSDQWVPGSEVIKSSSKPQALIENGATPSSSDSPPPADPAPSSATVQAVNQDMAKIKEQRCKEARDQYDKAIHARRITTPGKDGQPQYLSDAEADAYRIRIRDEMDHACGTSTSQAPVQQ